MTLCRVSEVHAMTRGSAAGVGVVTQETEIGAGVGVGEGGAGDGEGSWLGVTSGAVGDAETLARRTGPCAVQAELTERNRTATTNQARRSTPLRTRPTSFGYPA